MRRKRRRGARAGVERRFFVASAASATAQGWRTSRRRGRGKWHQAGGARSIFFKYLPCSRNSSLASSARPQDPRQRTGRTRPRIGATAQGWRTRRRRGRGKWRQAGGGAYNFFQILTLLTEVAVISPPRARPGIVSGDGGWSTMRAEGMGGGGDKVRGAGKNAKKNIFLSMFHSQKILFCLSPTPPQVHHRPPACRQSHLPRRQRHRPRARGRLRRLSRPAGLLQPRPSVKPPPPGHVHMCEHVWTCSSPKAGGGASGGSGRGSGRWDVRGWGRGTGETRAQGLRRRAGHWRHGGTGQRWR